MVTLSQPQGMLIGPRISMLDFLLRCAVMTLQEVILDSLFSYNQNTWGFFYKRLCIY